MKKEVKTKNVIEVPDEGLVALLGQNVILLCANYFYTGTLVGINDTCVELENTKIVYETGRWDDPQWKDAQTLPSKIWYVQTAFIESFGAV